MSLVETVKRFCDFLDLNGVMALRFSKKKRGKETKRKKQKELVRMIALVLRPGPGILARTRVLLSIHKPFECQSET